MIILPFVTSRFFSGPLRGIIYDLNREDYAFVPHDLVRFYSSILYKPIEIVNLSDEKNKFFFDYLIENEHIFLSLPEHMNNFPELDLTFKYPGELQSAIIIVENSLSSNFNQIILRLLDFKCMHAAIIFKGKFSFQEYNTCLSIIENLDFISIEIFTDYENLEELLERFQTIFVSCKKLLKLIFFNSPNSQKLISGLPIFSITKNITEQKYYNQVSISSMNPKIETFKESLIGNIFHHQKIIVSQYGIVFYNIEKPSVFNIFEVEIKDLFNDYLFFMNWYTKKDEITVCNDCEFRHMCNDSAEILKRTNGSFFRSSECNYNPYLALWSTQPMYRTLAESGVQNDEDGFYINFDVLNTIQRELHGVEKQ